MRRPKSKLPSPNIIMVILSSGIIYVLLNYNRNNSFNTFWLKTACVSYAVTATFWVILNIIDKSDDKD